VGLAIHPFQLLNEMDGLGEDLDVTFLLTTNRADLLEPALAERPGRVDHAALLPIPDAGARLRLLHLYRGRPVLDLSDPDAVISRTEGVTASFMKELLRRAALRAAGEPGQEDTGQPIRVTDAHLAGALGQLLDTRDQLTQVLLGGRPPSGARLAGQVLHQGGGDLAGLGDAGEVRAAPDHPEPGPADA
jgi:SpoVK/Ycf46/Vps4 family AAA+-type ATPase